MPSSLFCAVLLSSVVFVISGALGHEPSTLAQPDRATPRTTEPLYDNLGDLSWTISTDSQVARRYFDQGLRWTYAFNHAAARRAFQEAQRQDSNCAMCYWGEAFVLGSNINAPMEERAVDPSLMAIARAQAVGHHASPREQALIEALATRYSSEPGADRATLAQAYADAMSAVRTRFPDDENIAVLYADAVMNTSPWDYWQSDGRTPRGRIGEAIAAVEGVLAKNPVHPGAIHLYIHLVEASATPERAESYADRLPVLMPGAGHMVHMASHIYYRVGRFHDSAGVNKRAVDADDAYLAEVDDHGLWANGYHPHNIHFVLVSALMAGDATTALEYAERLQGKISDDVAAEIGWIQAIKQAPYFAHAHLSDPDTILALDDPGNRFPYVKVAWHYARGAAFARRGKIEKARGEAARIADIGQRHDPDAMYPADIAFVAPDVLRIARHVVLGRIAQAEKDFARAVREFDAASQIEDSLAYLEPPFWYYPVRQSLGAALIQAGKPDAAERVFAENLDHVPNNGWALFGLMHAQKAQGEVAAAAKTEKLLRRAWIGNLRALALDRL